MSNKKPAAETIVFQQRVCLLFSNKEFQYQHDPTAGAGNLEEAGALPGGDDPDSERGSAGDGEAVAVRTAGKVMTASVTYGT